MKRQAEEAATGGRRQAEAILAAAKDAIEKLFNSIAGEAEQVLEAAERDAAEHKTKIEGESAKLLAGSRAEAERLRSEADATKAEVTTMREAAASETAELRAEAERLRGEADATKAKVKAMREAAASETAELRAEAERLRGEADATKAKVTAMREAAASETAEVRSETERLRKEAHATTAEARAMRKAAASEAAGLRAEAARQAAATVEKARAEYDTLSTRLPDLRMALSQFEAKVHALAEMPAIDLNQAEPTEAAEPVAEVVVTISADVDVPALATDEQLPIADEEKAPAGMAARKVGLGKGLESLIPVDRPDGGDASIAMDQVPPDQPRRDSDDEYSDLKEIPVDDGSVDDVVEEVAPAPDVEPEPASAPAAGSAEDALERLAARHTASRAMPPDNEKETIYQRRGGGLRRRIKAQGDE